MTPSNKIILTAEADLIDEEARIWLSKLQTKVDTLNERTKSHTLQIAELRKMIKNE